MALAGLALGILAMVAAWFPFLDVPAWIMAFGGIVCSVAGIGRSYDHGKLTHAIFGAALSMLAMFSKIGIYLFLFKNPDSALMKSIHPILQMFGSAGR